jgi:hypothetical protein
VADVNGRDLLRWLDFDFGSCPSIRFVSNRTIEIPFWPLKGP